MGNIVEGTKVTMADGSEKTIENIRVGDILKGQPNNPTVTATSMGLSTHPLIRIQTSSGTGLTLSQDHPVLTPNGVVSANHLKLGMSIYTQQGVYDITSLVNSAYAGNVYSLHTGNGFGASSNFYANGILVGVSEMRQKSVVNPLNELNRLPKEWHQDYLDALKDDSKK